jgi:hypothetical protein
MKKWNIVINAENEQQAAVILKAMSNAFEVAGRYNLPMESIFMDHKGVKEMSSCELVK